MTIPSDGSRPISRRPHRRALAAVALAVLGTIAVVPATALAGTWGPRSSYYDGTKRVTGTGTLTRLSTGSRSKATACDNRADGWPVYAYTNFFQWQDGAHSKLTASVVMRSSAPKQNACSSGTWTQGWNSFYGFWVEAGACAEVGWPVPNNCVNPAYESHTP